MAGTQPNVPGRRFAYDQDGTLVRTRNPDGSFREHPQTKQTGWNSEDSTSDYAQQSGHSTGQNLQALAANPFYTTFVFPELRDLTGYFADGQRHNFNFDHPVHAMQTSTDTTDGSDGTWTTLVGAWTNLENADVKSLYRANIVPVNVVGIRGVRFGHGSATASADTREGFSFYAIHLYGRYVGATDGLRFWDPTSDVEMLGTQLEFPDVPQGSSLVRTFRLKNTSAQTANSTTISAVAQTAGADAGLVNGLTFSLDNITYAASVTIPTLAPGATSSLLYARRTVGPAEVPLNRSARVQAIPTSWT